MRAKGATPACLVLQTGRASAKRNELSIQEDEPTPVAPAGTSKRRRRLATPSRAARFRCRVQISTGSIRNVNQHVSPAEATHSGKFSSQESSSNNSSTSSSSARMCKACSLVRAETKIGWPMGVPNNEQKQTLC